MCFFASSPLIPSFPLLALAAVNGAVAIKDPFSGLERGSLNVLLAVGGEEQIARLHKMENAAALIQVCGSNTCHVAAILAGHSSSNVGFSAIFRSFSLFFAIQ